MKRYIIALLLLPLLLNGCVPEQPKNTTYHENFEALWKIMDEKYCFFEEKNVNWDMIYKKYDPMVRKLESEVPNDFKFFLLMNEMLREVKDGHVNLISSFNRGRYNDWIDDSTKGLNIYERSKLLGNDYFITGGMIYAKIGLSNNDQMVGYIIYNSFSSSLGDMNFLNKFFADCAGLIIDVRGNGGGLVDNSNRLASYFFNERTLVGYSSHKTGPGHDDFSPLKPLYIKPSTSFYYKKPVVVLQDRGSYSATNDFLMKMALAPQVRRIGLRSGGGGGMPAMSEMPNGWRVRFSSVRSYDVKKESVEAGIDPDIEVSNNSYYKDPQNQTDKILMAGIGDILTRAHDQINNDNKKKD